MMARCRAAGLQVESGGPAMSGKGDVGSPAQFVGLVVASDGEPARVVPGTGRMPFLSSDCS